MSLDIIQKPVVPCSICKIVMVELGKMGDTGKKKCNKCRYRERMQYQKDYYARTHQDVELECLRCGKSYQEKNGVDICEICRMLAVDLFRASQEQECIYCGRPSDTRKFCSHNCLVKTTKLAAKRERKIDEVLID